MRRLICRLLCRLLNWLDPHRRYRPMQFVEKDVIVGGMQGHGPCIPACGRVAALAVALLLVGCAFSPDNQTLCKWYGKRITCKTAF